jgi:hypothetical protein
MSSRALAVSLCLAAVVAVNLVAVFVHAPGKARDRDLVALRARNVDNSPVGAGTLA